MLLKLRALKNFDKNITLPYYRVKLHFPLVEAVDKRPNVTPPSRRQVVSHCFLTISVAGEDASATENDIYRQPPFKEKCVNPSNFK